LEKINFITNKNKSKNQVGNSNSQMLLYSYVLFVLQNVFENDSVNRNTTYRNFNFDWVKYIKLKQGEFLHKLAYCQQAGGWQFEHLIL
jgi:hypothetical protein